MTRTELATEINRLSKSGELVSSEQHRELNKMSRSWSDKDLKDESKWIKIRLYKNNYYLKEE